MNPRRRRNSRIQAELDELASRQILTATQAEILKARYPTEAWDLLPLVRSFTVLGVLMGMAGVVILARQWIDGWVLSEIGLAVATAGFVAAGWWLKTRHSMPLSARALELAGAMALQGLTVVLAIHHSTGSKDWPSLVGMDAVLLFSLAYALANPLVLWYACANLFFYFGAETGYLSGWGAYWLGMTYPMRYLGIGAATLVLSWGHGIVVRGRWSSFTRVYAHYGLLLVNIALWFLSLFGYYEDFGRSWSEREGDRLTFSILWALVSGASVYASGKTGLRLLRAYGFTFLLINLYTFYFQFVVAHTGELWFLHFLFTGGSLLGLGMQLEKRRRRAKEEVESAVDKTPPGEDLISGA